MSKDSLELLLLRHAKSSWDSSAQTDHERPLNDRGIRAAATMARFCQNRDLLPDRILASDSCRTRETVERFIETANWDGPIVFTTELYHASLEMLIDIARSHGEGSQRLMIVAHNPGIEELTSLLSGETIVCPTATLSQFRVASSAWTDWRGQAIEHLGTWRPKELVD